MVDIYCKLIINKRKTFDDIPANLKTKVEARLKEFGYDIDGNVLA